MFNIRVINSFGVFVCDKAVDSWDDVEKVYFDFKDHYPWYDIEITKVSLHETTLGI